MKGNDGPKGQNKEIKAQKAKMKGNESPRSQKLQNAAGLGADKICFKFH